MSWDGWGEVIGGIGGGVVGSIGGEVGRVPGVLVGGMGGEVEWVELDGVRWRREVWDEVIEVGELGGRWHGSKLGWVW